MRMMKLLGALAATLLLCGLCPAQTTTQQASSTAALGGVMITPEGLLRMGRTPATQAAPQRGAPSLTYVSLPGLFEQVRSAAQARSALPREVRYLQGLTRIDFLFVYPEQHDLVIAGPSEPVRDANPLQPVGAISGRPVLQADDLVVALRAMQQARNDTIFGCSLDLAPNAAGIAAEVGRKFAGASRAQVAEELKKALGPQQVRILGVPSDSRVALAMITADYRLKRIAMGAETLPGVGNAISSGIGASRVWFEPAYDPLVVSQDKLSYQFAGPRLKVLAGAQEFDARSATPAATAFAKRFSEKMPESGGRLEALADLQNVTDLFLLAAVMRQDGLAGKAGVDLSWILSPEGYRPASLTVPRTAETVIADTGTMITEGGVFLASRGLAPQAAGAAPAPAVAALQAKRARPEKSWFLTLKSN